MKRVEKMGRNTREFGKESKIIDLKPALKIIGIIILPLALIVLMRISTSDANLVPSSVFALILGAIFESKLITQKWSTVLYTVLAAFVFSLFGFIPGKHEHIYNLDEHIMVWPYLFLFIYVLAMVVFNEKKITPKLSESATMIMSVAIIYWVVDHGFYSNSSALFQGILLAGSLVAVFCIINAFLNIPMTGPLRLFLSIWSSFVMALLAIDNIYLVYLHGQIEDSVYLLDKIEIGLQYFMLGVCSIYIAQNILMILSFMPGKGELFNDAYFKRLDELKKEHIQRYSMAQSSIIESSICLIVSCALYAFNYHYQILPRNTAIWIVIFILTRVLYWYGKRKQTKALTI
jgi:hypothetical protein